jgi:hypothetical protein
MNAYTLKYVHPHTRTHTRTHTHTCAYVHTHIIRSLYHQSLEEEEEAEE